MKRLNRFAFLAALYLPRVVRAAWQGQQPALARIGAGPRAPQL